MNLNPAQYVAVYNTPSVIQWAASVGQQIQGDANSAYAFMLEQFNINPVDTALKIKAIHPHIQEIEAAIGTTLQPQNGINVTCKPRKGTFRNYADNDDLDPNTVLSDIGRIINEGIDRGVQTIRNVTGNNPQKDPTNEMLKYGAVFLAGFVLCKLLSK